MSAITGSWKFNGQEIDKVGGCRGLAPLSPPHHVNSRLAGVSHM